jgi:hypothetical protein
MGLTPSRLREIHQENASDRASTNSVRKIPMEQEKGRVTLLDLKKTIGALKKIGWTLTCCNGSHHLTLGLAA